MILPISHLFPWTQVNYWLPLIAFSIGLLIAALVIFLWRALTTRSQEKAQRYQEIERQVATQTASLRLNEERLRLLVDTALDAVLTVDAQGLIIDWNAQAEATFGWSRQEVLGTPLAHRIVPPQYRQAHESGFQRFLATGQSAVMNTRIEIVALHRHGHEFPVELSVCPVLVDGQYTFSAFIRDITTRKQAEADLSQARDAALAAARAKANFLATMSHEIRTPMNGIIGMTDLLLDMELTPEQRECITTINRSGEALLLLINDILDFSKIDAGKLELECVDFELRVLLEDILELLAEQAHSKNLELAYLFPEDVPLWVAGDPGRLRQILLNLVSNAVKFTEAGEVVVKVSLTSETAEEALLRFEVVDTGIGLSFESQQQLFHAFSQADTSTTRKYGGTGLGLAISKRLTEIMGGHIGVESALGQGSTFWFTVRLKKRQSPLHSTRMAGPELQNLRVLGVDDNATNRTILECQLHAWSMTIDCVNDAASALERLREAQRQGQPYNLAILDYQMPEMDGLALAQAIKQEPLLASIPLILLSSLGRPEDRQAVQEAGLAASLTKPVRQSQLYDCIASVMNAAPSPSSVQPPQLSILQGQLQARVLLAEDNLVNQKVAGRLLEKCGCQVDIATNGKEAIEAAARQIYDLVLMDCQMPEMDGFAATAVLRARERSTGQHIPIIAMTANALEGDRERCLAAGMDDYLSKPVKADVLLAMLQKWTNLSAAAPASAEAITTLEGVSMQQPPALDAETFAALKELGGDEDTQFVTELIADFVQDATTKIVMLHTAVNGHDAATLERMAHALKSASANMGALGMADLCLKLQELGRAGKAEAAVVFVARLEGEFTRVREALAQERQRLQESLATPLTP